MKFAAYLHVNNVLEGTSRTRDMFQLPDKMSIFRSARFGEHALGVEKDVVTIFPLKKNCQAEADSDWELPHLSSASTNAVSRREREGAKPAPRNDVLQAFAVRIGNALLCCKARAASFFW